VWGDYLAEHGEDLRESAILDLVDRLLGDGIEDAIVVEDGVTIPQRVETIETEKSVLILESLLDEFPGSTVKE